MEAPLPNTGTDDIPANSNKACDCSWVYPLSDSVLSWCSDNKTSGSYSSALGDSFSVFTSDSSSCVFVGLFETVFVIIQSVLLSFDLEMLWISAGGGTLFTDKLALISLLEGFIPGRENIYYI